MFGIVRKRPWLLVVALIVLLLGMTLTFLIVAMQNSQISLPPVD